MNRNDGGYCVLVNHLLLAVGVQHHGEAVKAGDAAPQLKAVHQKYGNGQALLADLGQENVLKIVFCITNAPFLFVRTAVRLPLS